MDSLATPQKHDGYDHRAAEPQIIYSTISPALAAYVVSTLNRDREIYSYFLQNMRESYLIRLNSRFAMNGP